MAGSAAASRVAGAARSHPTTLAAVGVFVAALLVYRTTLLPGVFAWDTAEAQAVLPLLGTMHPTGFPAYVILGWLASIALQWLGEPAFLMNLLSALLVAGAAGIMVVLLRRLPVPMPVAIAAAIGLALTPIAWAISAAADAHALHLFLLALLVLALVRWEQLVERRDAAGPDDADDPDAGRRADRAIVLAAAVFGVSLANHALTVLLVPAIGLYVLAVEPGVLRRGRLILACLGTAFGVAALLYLELPLRAGPFPAPLVYGHPDTWQGFWDIVLARQFQGTFDSLIADPVGKLLWLGRLALGQLGVLAVLIPFAFIVTAGRFPRYALLSGVAALVTCLFAATYLNAIIERYYLGPALFAWTWLAIAAGVVVDGILDRARGRPDDVDDDPLATPAGTSRFPATTTVALAVALALLVPTAVALEPRWTAVDRHTETAMTEWLDDAMFTLDQDGVVVSFWTYSTTLWYGQLVEGRRPDLLIIDDSDIVYDDLGSVEEVIDTWLPTRPVYVIRATPAEIDALAVRYELRSGGLPDGVFRVIGPQETSQ